MLTRLDSPHHYLVPEHFHRPKQKPQTHEAVPSHPPPSSPWYPLACFVPPRLCLFCRFPSFWSRYCYSHFIEEEAVQLGEVYIMSKVTEPVGGGFCTELPRWRRDPGYSHGPWTWLGQASRSMAPVSASRVQGRAGYGSGHPVQWGCIRKAAGRRGGPGRGRVQGVDTGWPVSQ